MSACPVCRACNHILNLTFCNLGETPLANSYVKKDQVQNKEPFFPLHAYVCSQCFLVQLQQFETPVNIFSDYSYFSSYSQSWLIHAKEYANQMITRYQLNQSHQVIEIASNDGYLLQFFKEKGIPVLGIEPAQNVAVVAEHKGIPTLVKFFGRALAEELKNSGIKADVIVANNVLAHVPNLNDFVEGIQILLAETGVATFEFPHLMELIKNNQFDTIYHEHFSYFSLIALQKVFAAHQLKIVDIDQLLTHGGSLRLFVRHLQDCQEPVALKVAELMELEKQFGLDQLNVYENFNLQAAQVKNNLLSFFEKIKKEGKTIAGYGAPAKGNTLLNYCNIGPDFLSYTVDLSPHKQGTFLPGTRIPVHSPDMIFETKPDYLLILPWNLSEEIIHQMHKIRDWGAKFVIAIPDLQIID